MCWLMAILIFRLPKNAARFSSSIPARSASRKGDFRQLRPAGRGAIAGFSTR
jgi:hypothetical protein